MFKFNNNVARITQHCEWERSEDIKDSVMINIECHCMCPCCLSLSCERVQYYLPGVSSILACVYKLL